MHSISVFTLLGEFSEEFGSHLLGCASVEKVVLRFSGLVGFFSFEDDAVSEVEVPKSRLSSRSPWITS
jgi:hypothetical protein